ncbi:hypothetical protein CRENBAI_002357, partial [Crenichthys baileyi]
MVERPEEERDGQGNSNSSVPQAHPSPRPCAASSQGSHDSVNTRFKLLQCAGLCFEEDDDAFSTIETECTSRESFQLGKSVLSPERNKLSNQRFERLLLMRYNY